MIALEDFIYSIKLPLPEIEEKECLSEIGETIPCAPRMLGLADLCRQEYITDAIDEAEWDHKCKNENDEGFCLPPLPKKCYTS